MLIGSKKNTTAQTPQNDDGADIFDVTTADFEHIVLKASMKTPVLIDFWAPWCGPCKQLGPMLESAVLATRGAVRMAKVNIDENPELAQAMKVQSVPTVYVFFQGQPITAFTGVRSQSEINILMDQLIKIAQQGKPDALNIPETLKLAAESMALGDIPTAQGLYAQILGADEHNVAAYVGLVRSFIALQDLEQAQYMIDDAPVEISSHADFAVAKTALELAGMAPKAGDLEKMAAKVTAAPDDHQQRFDYALALFGAGQRTNAIDQLLDIMRRDKHNEKKWDDDKARTQLLKFFEAMGPSDPETLAGRRKLSSLLFS
ncbi:MAG: tetratricopeptide repeat protein [Micavibrio sp.]